MIAIDPGAKGAIVFDDQDGVIRIFKMGETPGDVVAQLLSAALAKPGPAKCVWERTGTYMPGNSGPSAATFARHCGGIEYALIALGVSQEQVLPNKWMKAVLGTVPKDKGDRKRAIKKRMQELYPALHITLETADALAIWHYAKGMK